jgi:mono/diheme cytochrome c family protein
MSFPFTFRGPVGLWKQLYFYPNKKDSAKKTEGQYLVEALGHCAECHTPRNIFGALDNKRFLAGAKSIKNKGAAPNITPHKTGIEHWTVEDIVNYLDTGFTPDFDSAGGQMVSVITNLSKLPKKDLVEIAKYLKSVRPVASN